MNVEKVREEAKNIEDVNKPNNSGGTNGLYIMFSKWREDAKWTFVQSYITKEGFLHMLNNANDEILENQDVKLMFANGDTHEFLQIFNTMDLEHEETN